MVAVEFANFGAMLVMWLLIFRALQALFANTWLSPALGAITG